jgi:hypothetical protein
VIATSALLTAALLLSTPLAPAVGELSRSAAGEAGAAQPASRIELTSRGRSGALRALVVPPGESLEGRLSVNEELKQALSYSWSPVSGAASARALVAQELRAPSQAGSWRPTVEGQGEHDSAPVVITSTHFDGSKAYLNGYHIGRYPAQLSRRTGRYAPPEHFIEVTPDNQHLAVSEHFQLRHFLTKDQADVWPKYLVLDLKLVDKLELVIQELRAMGFPAKTLHVMSGYRTPQYNGPGGKGRAKFSRHTYGDAADVWLDDDGDGQMDDLNRDGLLDVKDAEVLASAVERVEQREPELVGGHGVYRPNRVHGPFVHIDVRGAPARWSMR